jgi:hypothetical protein
VSCIYRRAHVRCLMIESGKRNPRDGLEGTGPKMDPGGGFHDGSQSCDRGRHSAYGTQLRVQRRRKLTDDDQDENPLSEKAFRS